MDTLHRALTLISLICVNGASGTSSWNTIHVSSRGSSIELSCGGSVGNSCKTLDLGLRKALHQGGNNTRILLEQGSYTLSQNYEFATVTHFHIAGKENSLAVIDCSSDNVSIAFLFSHNIELHNLRFQKCGGWKKSLIGHNKSTEEMFHMKYITALYFNYCKHVQMRNVEVTGSDGVGVTLSDVSGTVNITNSRFEENLPRYFITSEPSSDAGSGGHAGGGVFLLLNSYGYNPLNTSRQAHDSYQHNGSFFFTNVDFIRNQARGPDLDDKLNTPLTPFSRGGGLGIYLFGNASGNAFKLSRCRFIGNRAQWGGGLQIELKHETENNTVEVRESVFKENFGAFAGGGVRLGDITISKTALQPNTFHLDKCKFFNNTSTWGGGASVYGTTFVAHAHTPANLRDKFEFNNCEWFDNNGNIGSALGIFLFNLNEDNIGPLVPIHVVLKDCNISNNDVITNPNDPVLIGQGAVYTVNVPIIFKGYTSISNNSHTSMVLDSALLFIHGETTFSYNTGYRGGALALYGNSKVQFSKKSKLFFLGNKCLDKGGAMYVDAPGSPQVSFNATGYATHQCFFEYFERFLDFDLWEIEVIFQGNFGPSEQSGLSAYITSLQNCRRVGETRKNNSALQWGFVKFYDSSGNLSDINIEVSTDPVGIEFRKDDWHVAPSQVFNATITLRDEIWNPVYGIVKVDVQGKTHPSKVRLATSSSLFLVHHRQINLLSLAGRGGDAFDVVLRSEGRHYLTEVIADIKLKQCNAGFQSSDDKCVCSESVHKGISRCANNGQTVFLKHGYWAGTIGSEFHTVPCPVNYCKCLNPFGENAIGECTYQQNQICEGNRDDRSILCGKCKPGYTASFGSEACVLDCSSSRIAIFIPIGVVLFLLVMGLMAIKVDAFTGYLNAWLYSYQVIALLTPENFEFDVVMEFIIGLANLRFRVGDSGTCFTRGLDEADKLVIMYTLPAFVLLIAFVVAQLAKCYPNWRYNKYLTSPFSGLSAIFVLCYTNFTGISLKILNPTYIGKNMRVFAQGELVMFEGKHLVYGLMAIFCIITIVIPIPLLLMFQPWIAKWLRPLKINVQKLKPIFDKLQGCFKDQYRWCAAFYFLSRLLLLLLVTFVPQSPLKRALLESASVVILVLFVWLRPYKEGTAEQTDYSWINISDAVLLTNLTLIAIFSSAIDENPKRRTDLMTFVRILAYIPLIVLAVVLYRAVDQRYRNHRREGQTKFEFIFKPNKNRPRNPETETSTSDYVETTACTLNRRSDLPSIT